MQEDVLYGEPIGAIIYMFNFLFGNADDGPFRNYELKNEQPWLYVFYVIAGFLIIVILLNMIIAIMSDTQARRSAHGRNVIFKTKLKMILNFWSFIVNHERNEGTKFLIAALKCSDDANENQSEST